MDTKGKTILIVDDDEDIRELVEITLEDSKYRLLTAEDGEAGLAAIYEYQPDLVILDWVMPKLDGLTVLRQLRKNSFTTGIPVLLLTSEDDTEHQAELRTLGIFAYLQKPFSPLELIHTVEKALAG
ncbi:MAG: response regulator [Nitrospirales bacterium]|nr:response regulator [Nitrospira sp.]MDR4503118.1 response regulator [Nitrospirales bacterium]